nr:unnamed protein product [Callosobruchus analis]
MFVLENYIFQELLGIVKGAKESSSAPEGYFSDFNVYTPEEVPNISNKNDAKHEEPIGVTADVDHHSDEGLAAPKDTNSNTEHEESCGKSSTNKANWRFEVSSVAARNLNLNKWNKTTIIPLASDLKLLMNYLLDIAKQNIEKLQTDTRDAITYNNLVETIFCRANWRFEVSSVAARNLNLNKWNKTTIIPLASDLKLLMNYLLDIAKQNIEKLQTDTRDAITYNNLVETIFCRVILLNRRRPGELQRMLLDIYMNCGNDKEPYQEFENIIAF